MTLFTDIIIGFPGENDADFEQTKDLVMEIKFDVVNLSKFGSRPLTEAAGMGQLDRKLVNKRSVELSKIIRKISAERNKKYVGWSGKVFVNGQSSLVNIGPEKTYSGRNIFYKLVSIKTDKEILGKLVDVKIIGSTGTVLVGELI